MLLTPIKMKLMSIIKKMENASKHLEEVCPSTFLQTQAQFFLLDYLRTPAGIALNQEGNLVISDSYRHRIEFCSPQGNNPSKTAPRLVWYQKPKNQETRCGVAPFETNFLLKETF